MKVQIHSRQSVVTSLPPGTQYAIISITDPESTFALTPTTPSRAALHLKFHDVEESWGSGYRVISDEQAEAIAAFVKAVKDDVDLFVINCDAGISRSSATAAVVSEYLGLDTLWILQNSHYFPNATVMRKLRKAFGIDLQSYLEGQQYVSEQSQSE
jgi:predicted protein tyrosine phosphatase